MKVLKIGTWLLFTTLAYSAEASFILAFSVPVSPILKFVKKIAEDDSVISVVKKVAPKADEMDSVNGANRARELITTGEDIELSPSTIKMVLITSGGSVVVMTPEEASSASGGTMRPYCAPFGLLVASKKTALYPNPSTESAHLKLKDNKSFCILQRSKAWFKTEKGWILTPTILSKPSNMLKNIAD